MTSEPPPNSEPRLAPYQALLDVCETITRHADTAELFHDLARRLRPVVAVDFITVLLYDADQDLMRRHLLEPANPEHVYRGPEVTPRESPGGVVWQTQEEIVIPDLEAERRYPEMSPIWQRIGMKAACYLPLTIGLRRLGAINFASARPREYGTQELELLRQVARLVAVAVDNALNYQKAERYQRQLSEERDRLRLLLEINNAVVTHLDLRQLCRALAVAMRRLLRQDYLSLALYEPAQNRWRLYAFDFPANKGTLREEQPIPFDGAPASAAYVTRQPAHFLQDDLERLDSDVARRLLNEGIRSLYSVPLLSRDRVLATLNAGRLDGSAFLPEEMDLLVRAAGQIALAVDNALAFREISALKDKLAQEKLYLEDEIRTEGSFSEIVGESATIQRILRQVEIVAPTPSTVLIQGETGTGKELIACALHRLSTRREHTFVKLNCAAIPTGLLESELFGHERGAFTGAIARKVGRFELADGGTLFLDEVGDIPPELQPKLLRVLQEQEFERLGSTRTLKVDIRLVAATNRDLMQMVADRQFRADLFYRLNVFPILMPPLRERPEDIPALTRYFTQQHSRRLNRPVRTISDKATELLSRYPWPGNVRELENYIERSVLLSPGNELRVSADDLKAPGVSPTSTTQTLMDAEREHILKALDEAKWVIGGPSGAAARLGMKRTTLQLKMRKLGIERP